MAKIQRRRRRRPITQPCGFCEGKLTLDYKNEAALKNFLSSRGRILARSRTGICAKHQRQLARAIKRARHLALLPFVVKVKEA
jgi:small subunit ribosomal protein S18